MSRTMNNLVDRKSFINYNKNENDFEGTTYIMDRTTFIRPENRKIRDEHIERFLYSKIEDIPKSTFGVNILVDDEKVRYFDKM